MIILNIQYQGEVMEMLIQDDVLRVTVEDNDTPNTPGWRAKYFFIKGNEEGHYKITTDPKTNQGILSVIKVKFCFVFTVSFIDNLQIHSWYDYLRLYQGKDYEKTSFVTLEVGVKNEEPRWVCKGNFASGTYDNFYDSAIIKMKVKDVNDPPVFAQNPVVLHETEEEKPGKVLFTPEVKDEDSDISEIRLILDFFLWCIYLLHCLNSNFKHDIRILCNSKFVTSEQREIKIKVNKFVIFSPLNCEESSSREVESSREYSSGLFKTNLSLYIPHFTPSHLSPNLFMWLASWS